MEQTIRRLAKVLGATSIESAGHDSRFMVEGKQGGRMQVSIEPDRQRIMAVLKDASGIIRATVDLAPVTHATEDPDFPHRVTLRVGNILVHLDAEPTLAIEVVSEKDD
jgi:hypothetical protein